MRRYLTKTQGLTLIELLIVIAIIAILARYVFLAVVDAREASFQARAQSEFRSFESAMHRYLADNNGVYPPDANRNIPAGLEDYLSGSGWPNAPWPNSVYDWDVWDIGGEDVYQISIRFCPIGGPLSDCRFPQTDWAQNFGVNSAYFYCFDGPCQSHPSQAADYPGYCVNCDCKEMETCS